MGLFGSNKIEIILDKKKYIPGEIIKGNVKLKLKKSTFIKKLLISLRGIQEAEHRPIGKEDTPHPNNMYALEMFKFEKRLSYEGEYQNNDIRFEIEIPKDIFAQCKNPEHKAGIFQGMMNEMIEKSKGLYPLEWYIYADLEIPRKRDINIYKQIKISKNS